MQRHSVTMLVCDLDVISLTMSTDTYITELYIAGGAVTNDIFA